MNPLKLKYIGNEVREIPQHGIFKPGDVVDFNESLQNTGLFTVVKKNEKEGEE